MRSLFLLVIAVTSCVSIFGQATIADRINAAGALIQQGHYEEAIASLKTIEQSDSVSDPERGRVETLQGLALKQIGHLQEAQQSYEKALGRLAHDSRESVDYARALSCLGSLKVEIGDPKTGEHILRQAARIENQLLDRDGLTAVDLHLVGAAIGRKHWKDAQKYLDAAQAQASLAGHNTKVLAVDVDATAGWLASVTRHPSEAVSAYKDARDKCKELYGPQHPLTGWTYLLVGKSSAANGDMATGLANMRAGLAILKETLGARSAMYLRGELAFANVLEQAGLRPEAAQLQAEPAAHWRAYTPLNA
jgi:tetratricopeptide (TPR) repeat protein